VIFVNGNKNIRYRKNNESVNTNGNGNVKIRSNENKTKTYKTGKKENVKTQNGIKKFPNHFGRWIAGDPPPPYHMPLQPSNM